MFFQFRECSRQSLSFLSSIYKVRMHDVSNVHVQSSIYIHYIQSSQTFMYRVLFTYTIYKVLKCLEEQSKMSISWYIPLQVKIS